MILKKSWGFLLAFLQTPKLLFPKTKENNNKKALNGSADQSILSLSKQSSQWATSSGKALNTDKEEIKAENIGLFFHLQKILENE